MSENKRFKSFRSELNESEYSEVLTGYGYRSAHKDGAGLHHLQSAGALAGINAMLATISRGTFLDPNEAFLKMKVRLNVVQLDFDWRPVSWDGGVGSYDIPVRQFGRVDGYDALTGQIRFDGKANPTGGYTELNLRVDVELTPESLYVVNAKLMPKADVLPESVEEEAELDEELTPARQAIIDREKKKASKTIMRGKTAAERDRAYARGSRINYLELVHKYGKKSDKTGSPYQVDKRNLDKWRKAEHGMREEVEQIDELSAKTKRSYYEKSVRSSNKMRDELDSVRDEQEHKAQDFARSSEGQISVDSARANVRHIDGGEKLVARETELRKKIKQRERGQQQAKKTVKEGLIGGQKKLDVNKNKRLDSQDFAMLRAKKKPMKEYIDVSSGGLPLQVPEPGDAIADKSGKGKRFHKKALKMVEAAMAKARKPKKKISAKSDHSGAANVIGRQSAIKHTLAKYGMRW